MDRRRAKEVSDSFMADLVANQVYQAVGRMEDGEIDKRQAEAGIRGLFEYCGKPLEYEYKHFETGTRLYSSGRTKSVLKFYYSGKTTQHPKGICFFSVEVVANNSEYEVAVFGPLKLQSGELPEWLR